MRVSIDGTLADQFLPFEKFVQALKENFKFQSTARWQINSYNPIKCGFHG